MGTDPHESVEATLSGVGLTDEDVYDAMKSIPGFIDITMTDFREIYCIAHSHAMERFARSVAALDIMTKDVLSVPSGLSLSEVAKKMATKGVSGVPVTDEKGRVVGVISEKDFLNRKGAEKTQTFMAIVAATLVSGGCVSLSPRAGAAKDIMTSPPITIREDTSLKEMLTFLSQHSINRLPVIDPEGHLIGIVARSDVVSAVFRSRTC